MRVLEAGETADPDARSAAGYLTWLVRRDRASVAAAMAFGIVWMICQALVPAVVGRAIDAGVTDRDGRALLTWSLILLGLGVVQAVAGLFRHRFALHNFLTAAYRTVRISVRQANRLGSALPRRMRAGEVVAIGTSDINHIGGAIDITARGAGSLVAVLVVAAILLGTSAPLGLVVVLGVPVLMAVVGLLIRPLHRRQQEYREQVGRLTGRASDLVAGLRVLRGVGGEPTMAGRYREQSQALRVAGVRTARVGSLLEASQVMLPGIFLVLVTWLGARFALDGRITVGQLVAFYGYAAFLIAPLRQLTVTIDRVIRGHVAARRVVTVLSVHSDLEGTGAVGRAEAEANGDGRGELVDPASGIRIRLGRCTGLAAADPADAVLMADRLGRYQPGGAVRLNGVPLTDLDLGVVRERILVADNDARLFTGPLRADLDPDGTGRIADALAVAAAEDVIDGLPDGLDSMVAERGREFSGGQQQRLRLARALVADPEILILVEPTSAVDAHTEAKIGARLPGARRGRTTVVCSTSPLVLDRTDHVIFLVDGRVAAEGTHRDLLVADPRYARTVLREDG